LLFSFDTTTFNLLSAGGSFAQKMMVDRVFFKCGSSDLSCYVQMNVALKNNWKF